MPTKQNDDTREWVLGDLQDAGRNGATRDEIVARVGGVLNGNPVRAIGVCLGILKQEGKLVQENDRFILVEFLRHRPPITPLQYKNTPAPAPRETVPEYRQNRRTFLVELHNDPVIIEQAVGIRVRYEATQQWVNLPLFGSVRIFVGKNTPLWAREQEIYRGLSEIVVLEKGAGDAVKQSAQVLPGYVVVISPIEL